jgi:hypothetical protein
MTRPPLRVVYERSGPPPADMRYSIDVFDERDNLVEVLGRVSEMDLAKVTFRAACIKHPKKRIFVREGARVIARWDAP